MAKQYADKLGDELNGKPLDRALLEFFDTDVELDFRFFEPDWLSAELD